METVAGERFGELAMRDVARCKAVKDPAGIKLPDDLSDRHLAGRVLYLTWDDAATNPAVRRNAKYLSGVWSHRADSVKTSLAIVALFVASLGLLTRNQSWFDWTTVLGIVIEGFVVILLIDLRKSNRAAAGASYLEVLADATPALEQATSDSVGPVSTSGTASVVLAPTVRSGPTSSRSLAAAVGMAIGLMITRGCEGAHRRW